MATSKTPTKQLGTARAVQDMDCDASVAIGDWVYSSTSTNNLAVEATTNDTPAKVIGRVIDKPLSVLCSVQIGGIQSDAALVGTRGQIWLSVSGTATGTRPTNNYLQPIGWSFGDGTYVIDTSPIRVKLS